MTNPTPDLQALFSLSRPVRLSLSGDGVVTVDRDVVFQPEGDFYLRKFESAKERICAGCGMKTGLCGTWGCCDWDDLDSEDALEAANELIEEGARPSR